MFAVTPVALLIALMFDSTGICRAPATRGRGSSLTDTGLEGRVGGHGTKWAELWLLRDAPRSLLGTGRHFQVVPIRALVLLRTRQSALLGPAREGLLVCEIRHFRANPLVFASVWRKGGLVSDFRVNCFL